MPYTGQRTSKIYIINNIIYYNSLSSVSTIKYNTGYIIGLQMYYNLYCPWPCLVIVRPEKLWEFRDPMVTVDMSEQMLNADNNRKQNYSVGSWHSAWPNNASFSMILPPSNWMPHGTKLMNKIINHFESDKMISNNQTFHSTSFRTCLRVYMWYINTLFFLYLGQIAIEWCIQY